VKSGAAIPETFHVMAKPTGAICNLDCKYCFYLEKENLFERGTRFRMSDEVLEAYVRQQIEAQRGSEVVFAWQGGEPTLMGLEFFKKAVALQKRFAAGRRMQNAFQTNGVLLDDDWCEFFKRENFLIGISIDGPRELHDGYRVDKGGKPTFDRVMNGIELLKKHGVEFNTLSVVHRENALQPLTVYNFLKSIGSLYLQFIPLVERGAAPGSVTDRSVRPEDYGGFLVSIFEEWVRADVGKVFVQLFDVSLGIWMGNPSGLCLFSETCGDAVALEHNGDVFSCDHFVYPEYKLGNLLNTGLGDLVRSPRQREFGGAKAATLPGYCQRCEVRFACHGECPKNRFTETPDGEPGLNYLCAAYKRFFTHVNPAMRGMAYLALNRRAPAEIMTLGVPGQSR
jgi:uncharacterized protein